MVPTSSVLGLTLGSRHIADLNQNIAEPNAGDYYADFNERPHNHS